MSGKPEAKTPVIPSRLLVLLIVPCFGWIGLGLLMLNADLVGSHGASEDMAGLLAILNIAGAGFIALVCVVVLVARSRYN